jgi:hypothetical protein
MKMLGFFGIFLKVFAKREDEIINGAGGGIDIVAPDAL